MQQIRGMKVKPDSTADSASNEAAVQTSDNHSSSSSTPRSRVPSQSDTSQPKSTESTSRSRVPSQLDNNQPKAAEKTVLKKPTTREVVRDDATTDSAANVIPARNLSPEQPGSKNAVENGQNGGPTPVKETNGQNSGPTSMKEANVIASMSSNKQTELLRSCARCDKRESTVHEFKKCKK